MSISLTVSVFCDSCKRYFDSSSIKNLLAEQDKQTILNNAIDNCRDHATELGGVSVELNIYHMQNTKDLPKERRLNISFYDGQEKVDLCQNCAKRFFGDKYVLMLTHGLIK